MAISDNRVCPNCDYANTPDVTVCVRCGASLEGITTIAAPDVAAIEILEPLFQPPALKIGEVLFLVAGKAEPIIIKLQPDQHEIVLGRRVEGQKPPELDLADYGPVAGSVSRRHAVLRFSGEKPAIEDLGSTNGTWLNESRLVAYKSYPMRTGDLLRLGQQFVFVYFSTGATTIESVVLTDKRQTTVAPRRLTPEELTSYVGGYLRALEAIQKIINQMLGQPAARVGVDEINLHGAPAVIRVKITGASGAIRLVLDRIVPWRRQHMQELAQLWQMEPASADQAGVFRTTLSDDLALVTSGMLKRLVPHLADADQTTYAGLLLPHVRTVALHTFELSADQL